MTLSDHLDIIKSGSPASERLIQLLGGDDYLISVANTIFKKMEVAGRKKVSAAVVAAVCGHPESTAKSKCDNLILGCKD